MRVGRNTGSITSIMACFLRVTISADTRTRFIEEVKDRTRRLACRLNVRGVASDLIERLAIEQTLTDMGYLQLQSGQRC